MFKNTYFFYIFFIIIIINLKIIRNYTNFKVIVFIIYFKNITLKYQFSKEINFKTLSYLKIIEFITSKLIIN